MIIQGILEFANVLHASSKGIGFSGWSIKCHNIYKNAIYVNVSSHAMGNL